MTHHICTTCNRSNCPAQVKDVEYWIRFEWNKQRMYVCTLEEFILVDIWIHCCTKLKSFIITLENTLAFFIQSQQWRRNVRIALSWQLTGENWENYIDMRNCHFEWTNVWSVIPLFASLITPVGVNGYLHWLDAHQTAGETIECHSCN